jgi:hypothetical protein
MRASMRSFLSLLVVAGLARSHHHRSHGDNHDLRRPTAFDEPQLRGTSQKGLGGNLPVRGFPRIKWDDDESPLRIGHFNWTSVRAFKEKKGRCASHAPSNETRAQSDLFLRQWRDAQREPDGGVRRLQTINIPVYFHCITSGSNGACSTAVVNQQIEVLNSAFAPTFSFTLVFSQSYNRPEYYNCALGASSEARMKNELWRGGANSLNIYSCDTADGTLGWSSFPNEFTSAPTMDGVVLRRGTLPGGWDAPYNLGHTGVHEVRHSVRLGSVCECFLSAPPYVFPSLL